MGGIDFSSQEFLLSAIISKDKKMYDAYCEGDVYLYYAKGIGLVPKDGTKKTHPHERDLCKSTVLGLSYLMTKVGLAKKLTADTGRVYTEDEAQKLVDGFDRLFPKFTQWKEEFIAAYWIHGKVKIPDGWTMWGDNKNKRSVANCPIQGLAGAILRKTIQLAQDKGLDVCIPLHDACYIEFNENDLSAMDTLKDCMFEAFHFYFEGEQKEWAKSIRFEGEIWGPGAQEGVVITPKGMELSSEKIHVDKRGLTEYNLFSKFFTTSSGTELL
jgi:DNA polymerase I-like protein with 3'-5' exonuclease and polymerase domains